MEASSFERAVYIYTNLSSLDLERRAPKSATVRLQAILLGRWGVAQGCDCRSILDAIAMLIEGQRPDLAMVLIEQELNSQT